MARDLSSQKRDPAGRFPKKTDEQIIAEARLCKSKKEFRARFPGSEMLSRRRGLAAQMPWLEWGKTPNGYWNYERCIEESKKYSGQGRSAFQKKSRTAYVVSLTNGWLDDMPWLGTPPDPMKGGRMYYVYAYKFVDQHAVYVGLTMDKARRDRDHRSGECFSAVYNYASDLGITIPDMIVLESELLAEEAQYQEGYWVAEFRKQGWQVLNTGRVGVVVSSLGSLTRKWTTKLAVEEARKYHTRAEFAKGCNKAYRYVARQKLWHLIPWLPNKGNVTSFMIGDKPKATRRMSHNEFLQAFNEKNQFAATMELIGSFTSLNARVKVRCKVCGHEWDAYPRWLLKGVGCRLCGYKRASATRKKNSPPQRGV